MTDWNKAKDLIQGRFVQVDECLIWIGSISGGYGSVFLEGKNQRVHRLVYQLVYGPLPVGLSYIDVLHKCNRKLCSNPSHLYLGTEEDNSYDRYRDGCITDGRESFTEKEILVVLKLHDEGKSLRAISRVLKCDHHKVKRAITRWKK